MYIAPIYTRIARSFNSLFTRFATLPGPTTQELLTQLAQKASDALDSAHQALHDDVCWHYMRLQQERARGAELARRIDLVRIAVAAMAQ